MKLETEEAFSKNYISKDNYVVYSGILEFALRVDNLSEKFMSLVYDGQKYIFEKDKKTGERARHLGSLLDMARMVYPTKE